MPKPDTYHNFTRLITTNGYSAQTVHIGLQVYSYSVRTGAKYDQILNYLIVLSPVGYRMLKYTSFANTTTDIYNVVSRRFDHRSENSEAIGVIFIS